MTEQGLNEDGIRRLDEEANIDRGHYTDAAEKTTVESQLFLTKKLDLMLEIGEHSEHLECKEARKELRRVQDGDPSATKPTQLGAPIVEWGSMAVIV